MGRNSYDDMSMRSSKGENTKKNILVAFISVLIILICVIIYIAFQPKTEVEEEETPSNTIAMEEPVSLEITPVAEVATMLETPMVKEEDAQEEVPVSDLFPSFIEYVVAKGDSLNSISQKSGISPETLAAVNMMTDITDLEAGQILYIPPSEGLVYTLREGDVLSIIFKKFAPDMDYEEFLSLNGIIDEVVEAGRPIFIPIMDTAEGAGEAYIRPVEDAEILFGFGELFNQDFRLDGIALSVSPGSAVRSIGKGFVTDVGIDPVFGRYVTIMHEDGYKSYYYLLETILVKVGQRVDAGSIIASVGTSSKYFGTPCLFFKMEQGTRTLNPMLFV